MARKKEDAVEPEEQEEQEQSDHNFDFNEELQIDEFALHEEWAQQPILMMKYSELLVNAKRTERACEEDLKVVRSELILEASDPDSGLLQKINVQTVEAYYRGHKRHKRAKDKLSDATYNAEMLQNAVFAFQARKMALENLVRLHGQNYFGMPNLGSLDETERENIDGHQRRSSAQKTRERLNPKK